MANLENIEGQNTEKKKMLSEESARNQIQNLLDSYRIDKNDLEIDNGPEWVASVVNRLVRAIRDGQMEVLENGKVKQNLVIPMGDVETITYRRVNGIAMKAADRAKGTFEGHCAFMGSLANLPGQTISKLDAVDLSIMQRLAQLFMVL